LNVTVFVGDIADAPAEALCTSTNPRLSLVMGTGAAIRQRGGDVILRACESIAAAGMLAAGSVHVTTAGTLACKCVIHCVASDRAHNSSDEVVRLCVENALAAAETNGCRTIAMPVFATGHAHLNFERSLRAMARSLSSVHTAIDRVFIVIPDDSRAASVRSLLSATADDR
jgi:O-acetyl-ADP-ribose deacetylase (regulator of RNase III)